MRSKNNISGIFNEYNHFISFIDFNKSAIKLDLRKILMLLTLITSNHLIKSQAISSLMDDAVNNSISLKQIGASSNFQQQVMLDGTIINTSSHGGYFKSEGEIGNIKLLINGNILFINNTLIYPSSGITVRPDKRPNHNFSSTKVKDKANEIRSEKLNLIKPEEYKKLIIDSLLNESELELTFIEIEQIKNNNWELQQEDLPIDSEKIELINKIRILNDSIDLAESRKLELIKLKNRNLANPFEKEGSMTLPNKIILNDFSLGLNNLSISNLLASSISYQGGMVELKANEKLSLRFESGVTNRIPSLAQMLREPVILNSFSGGNISTNNNLINPGLSQLAANNLIFNRDLINLNQGNFFATISASNSLDEKSHISLSHTFVNPTLPSNSIVKNTSLNSFQFRRNAKYYNLSFELASTQSNNANNLSLIDTNITNLRLVNNSIALGANINLEAYITKKSAITAGYRTNSANFYSPLQLFNNNIINELRLGGKRIMKKGKLILTSGLTNGTLLFNNRINKSNSIQSGLTYQIKENIQVSSMYSHSLLAFEEGQASSKVSNSSLIYFPRKNRNLIFQTNLMAFRFIQKEALDSIPTDLFQIAEQVNYSINKKYRLSFLSEYANSTKAKMFTNRFSLHQIVKDKIEITSGFSAIVLNSDYWLNLNAGISTRSIKNTHLNIFFERSIISNTHALFTGNFQVNMSF